MKHLRLVPVFLLLSVTVFSQHDYLFVGTYTNGESKGIYVYDLDLKTGDAKLLSVGESKNPSYLALAPGNRFLYAVNENGNDKPGEVSAFAFDEATGKLRFLNKQSSGGADPCYLSVSNNRKWILVANYSGGSLAALPVNAKGEVEPVAQLIQHEGTSVNKDRQEKAHVHMAIFSPGEKFLYTPDLGMDKVIGYPFNPSAKKPLAVGKETDFSAEGGAGPRHLAFHSRLPYAYLIEEMSGTVQVFKTGSSGKLKPIQLISSHPEGYSGEKGSADIHVSPDGKFLYASNRGDANSIAIYAIDAKNGKLTSKGFQPVNGTTPRNFVIEPGGKYLLVANQASSNITLFRINGETGALTATGKEIKVPNPVCLKLLRKPGIVH